MKPRELAAPDLLLAEDHHDHVVVFHLLLLGGAGWGSVAGEWLLGALMQIPTGSGTAGGARRMLRQGTAFVVCRTVDGIGVHHAA